MTLAEMEEKILELESKIAKLTIAQEENNYVFNSHTHEVSVGDEDNYGNNDRTVTTQAPDSKMEN